MGSTGLGGFPWHLLVDGAGNALVDGDGVPIVAPPGADAAKPEDLVISMAALHQALDDAEAGSEAVAITIAGGTYDPSGVTWSNRDFTGQRVTISAAPGETVLFENGQIDLSGSSNITLSGLHATQTRADIVANGRTSLFKTSAATSDITVTGGTFYGDVIDVAQIITDGTTYDVATWPDGYPAPMVWDGELAGENIVFTNNTISDVHSVGNFALRDGLTVSGNTANTWWFDGFRLVGVAESLETDYYIFENNFSRECFAIYEEWQPSSPHSDPFHSFLRGGAGTPTAGHLRSRYNAFIAANDRGDGVSGFQFTDAIFSSVEDVCNITVNDGETNGRGLDFAAHILAVDYLSAYNTMISDNGVADFRIQAAGGTYTVLGCAMDGNITEATLDGAADFRVIEEIGNNEGAVDGDFTAPTSNPTTLAAAKLAFRPSSGAATWGAVDASGDYRISATQPDRPSAPILAVASDTITVTRPAGTADRHDIRYRTDSSGEAWTQVDSAADDYDITSLAAGDYAVQYRRWSGGLPSRWSVDATETVAATVTAFTNDGTVMLQRTSAMTGQANSTLMAAYFKINASRDSEIIYGEDDFSTRLRIRFASDGRVVCEVFNDASTKIGNIQSDTLYAADTEVEMWLAYNGATGVGQLYNSSGDDLAVWATSSAGTWAAGDIDNWGVMGRAYNSTPGFTGDAYRMALWQGYAPDLSVEANRIAMAIPGATTGGTLLINAYGDTFTTGEHPPGDFVVVDAS